MRRGRLSQPATIGRLVLGHRGDRSGKQRRTYFCGTYVKNARRTLAVICTILALLLSGVGFLMQTYHIGALYQEQPGYQSIISQLVAAVVGRGVIITSRSAVCLPYSRYRPIPASPIFRAYAACLRRQLPPNHCGGLARHCRRKISRRRLDHCTILGFIAIFVSVRRHYMNVSNGKFVRQRSYRRGRLQPLKVVIPIDG